MAQSHLKNVAIIGAGGRVGGFIVDALLKQGMHSVTGITRVGSSSSMPAGLAAVKKADYESHESLVEAMRGQDVLIITLGAQAPPAVSEKLVDAAIAAGVRYLVPNEWGGDHTKTSIARDTLLGDWQLATRRYIDEKASAAAAANGGERMHWVSISCSFWYEFSLGGTEARYGFDFHNKKLTLFDNGDTKITTTTWPQTALALAKLLALPVAGASPCLSDWNDSPCLIESFTASQRDMFDSVLRVTGDKESDWTITHENSHERFHRGQKLMETGDMLGFALLLYTRLFFPDDPGNFHDKVQNKLLGLPEESIDEMTKVAIRIAEENDGPFDIKSTRKSD